MATTSISVDQDHFCCPVCLDLLGDPVTIPCGHSYCTGCIEDYWNKNKHKGMYSCPQCRQSFNPRPVLSRNTVLAEVVEKFQRTEFQAAPPRCSPKPEDARCDVCAGRKNTAVKSCLVCMASYCETHLKVHEEHYPDKAHKLIQALSQLKEKLCPRHDKLLRVYCRTDNQGVCTQCTKERHKGHDTVSVAAERIAQQRQLEEAFMRSKQKVKEREKELRHVVRYIKHSTDAAVEDSERIFTKLIRSIETQRCAVGELIRAQEKSALSQAEGLLKRVGRELDELERRDTELEQLSLTEDHIHFLQRCKSLYFPVKSVDFACVDVHPYLLHKTVRGSLADLKDRLEDVCERELVKISDKVKEEQSSLKGTSQQTSSQTVKNTDPPHISEPRTRSEFLQYTTAMMLDVNTANPYLSLSDGRREVTTQGEPRPYPDHPDRFTSWAQVLCRRALSGRCYWEAEWGGSGGVSIGVCYSGMTRHGGGSDCKLGHNSKSWSLDCSHSGCSLQHDKHSVAIAVPCSRRIGVYLDSRAGTLSFYSVTDTVTLLHRLKAAFTQPLYPGFWVGLGSTLKLCSTNKHPA